MYSGTSSKKQKPTTGYLTRPRLGPIRSIFSSKPMSSTQDKKKKFKKSCTSKMDFRKKPDYADTAYREAVGRLRILLAESYTPIKRPLRELDSAGEDTDNQSMVSANSRTSKLSRPYYHYLSMFPRRYYYPPVRPATTSVLPAESEKSAINTSKYENNSAPPELMSFIEKQEDYIEQLEKESRFCREELASLLSKVKDVISENENLHEKQKSNIMKSVFSHLETETETETEADLAQKLTLSPKKSKKSKVLEGPMIVFESRISELEAQLTQAKIDLRKALEENENYKKRIGDGNIIDGISYDNYKKQIDSLQREKDILQETVSKLQNALAKIKDKEHDTCDQVKRSLDVAEQAQYEKNAAELEIRRLKDELDRQHAKLRDAIADQGRRISDERSAVERRYTQQIEQLTAELGVQWETTNKLQLELDKQRRENADLRRELAQKQALLDGMKKDMQNKIMSLQSDIGVNGAEKSALEQQIATLQMTNERNERQSKQEIARLQAEMQSLRQRLDRADADLIHSRRENIRLNEQVASLEKEIKLNSAMSDEKNKQSSSGGEILALPPPKEQSDKQLSSLIQDMESKHGTDQASTKNESDSPTVRPTKRKEPIKVDISVKVVPKARKEIRELQTSLNRLNSRFKQSQITSSSVKDEDYNTISNQRTAQPQISSSKPEPNLPRNLSRTNSRASIKPLSTLSRKNSEDKTISSPPRQQSNQELNKPPSLSKDIYSAEYSENKDSTDEIQKPKTEEFDYETDPNQQYISDVNELYDQQYVGDDQSYLTEGQYEQPQVSTDDQLYSEDPSQQYTDQQYDTNQQYTMDPNQQYATDPSQQYATDPNQQYTTDPNQQYATDPSQQYATDPSQQYTTDPNQQYSDPQHQYYENQ